jgi:hypothetical protein
MVSMQEYLDSRTTQGPTLGLHLITPMKPNDHFNNAKHEDLVCEPIKPIYDGSPDSLIHILHCLNLYCQDEAWASIVMITQDEKEHDLLWQFTTKTEQTQSAAES